ncbi:ATP-binding protein [Paracoccus sp. 1_MG-2023]|uniref:ATP-binding protein n=1 Tax=unclassified Paracoccus (in: a-proteobacteria) TaxID=2688777 RepID=UPI002090DBC0|nr:MULTISPECIES: ATP-binding protein [unclassified Paracoccus (in: a-proteobacteria)]MDO6670005.1 ATP-binding protein [Paracoccus sp. 1_MG-2023]
MIYSADIKPDQVEIDHVLPKLRLALSPLLDADRLDCVEIVLAEALTNAVKHAQSSGTPEAIHLTAGREADHVWVEIVDAGNRSPGDLYDDLAAPDELDPMQVDGRGLSLIAALADHVEFEPAEGSNRLRLRFDQGGRA